MKRRAVHRSQSGMTMIELLQALLLATVVSVTTLTAFRTQFRVLLAGDVAVATEADLRVALGLLTDTLRNAGHGAPKTNLSSWIPWVGGFTQNPSLTANAAGDEISMAACFDPQVAQLALNAPPGATTLGVSGLANGLLDVGTRRLILIGDDEHAHVRSIGAGVIQIDTNPQVVGAQGLRRGYTRGTPICRIDVLTFSIEADESTGVAQLARDLNRGDGPEPLVEGITALEVDALPGGNRFAVELTARSARPSPISGNQLGRSLRAEVTLRNPVAP